VTPLIWEYRRAHPDQRRLMARILMRDQLTCRPVGRGSRANRRRLGLWCERVERSVERYFAELEAKVG